MSNQMQLERPSVERVKLTAVDSDGQKPSKTITVYNTTPEKLMKLIEQLLAEESERAKAVAAG